MSEKKLKSELIAEVEELKNKLLYKTAEFENYKRRTVKERADIFTMAVAEVAGAMLPVFDNLRRAVEACGALPEDDKLLAGVKMVEGMFSDAFLQVGVEEIKAVGEEFDPERHEAVMHVEDENAGANVVVEEFIKGYVCKDKVIRHSIVKVAN